MSDQPVLRPYVSLEERVARIEADLAASYAKRITDLEDEVRDIRAQLSGTLSVTDPEVMEKLFGFPDGIHPPAGFELTQRGPWFELRCETCSIPCGAWNTTPTQVSLDFVAQQHRHVHL